MANSVIQLKFSNATGNTPSSLANGEVAINTYDGKLFYRGGASNTILSIQNYPGPAGLNQEVQFNDNGTLGANANLSFDKSSGILSTKLLSVTNSTGDEGGEILLAKPVTNTSLVGTGITVDAYQNKIRFFEQGGTARGAYIDLTECVGGAGTNLLNPGSTPDSVARQTANAAFIQANAAFDKANTGTGGTGITAAVDRKTYTATTAQTIFAINYSSPYVLVAINGALVDPTEYTATNNTSITLVTGTQSGDIIDLIGFAGNVTTTAIDQEGRDLAQASFEQANAAFITANTADTKATSAGIYANGAFVAANSSGQYANFAFSAANTADVKATSAGIYANGAFVSSNAASSYANSGFARANTANTAAASGAIYANGAFIVANSAAIYANGAFASANNEAGVNLTQNTNITNSGNYANGAFAKANNEGGVNNTQNTNITNSGNYANGAFIAANTADSKAVSAGSYANSAFTLANNQTGVDVTQNTNITSAATYANGAFAAANSSGSYANSAFSSSNNKLSLTGGVITGSVNVSSNIFVGGFIDMNTGPSTPARKEGRLFYDNTQKALSYYNDGDVTLQIGQEHVVRVFNSSGATILNGRAVYIVPGASANGFMNVALANAATQVTSEVIGLATETIANGAYGYVTSLGKVNGLDTSLFTVGQELYLSDTVPGTYTNTPPNPPSVPLNIGYTTVSDVSAGQIYVSIHLMEGVNKTTGSILFARNNLIDQDPSHLYWDHVNNRLGINTGSPTANLHVAGDGLFTGNVTISGNLFVTNAQSIVTQSLDVGGNLIILNSNTTGTPVSNAEIRVNRGNQANAFIRWDESINEWVTYEGAGEAGHIITSEKTATTWAQYSTFQTYEKLKYPIGADLANATNETAKTADARSIVAENQAISGFIQANAAFAVANSASIYANGAFGAANTADSKAVSAGNYANAAFNAANTSSGGSAGDYANGAFVAANSAGSYANSAFTSANNINGVNLTQNTSITASFAAANTASLYANAAFITANSAEDYANSAFIAANSAGVYANSAYVRANNSLNANTGGLVTGQLNVSSNIVTTNLTLTSNATANLGALKLVGFPSDTNLNTGLLQIGVPLGFNDTNIILSAVENVNSYAQFILQNQSSGTRSSSDYIVNNDRPGGTAIYGDFGINSSTYDGPSPFNLPDGTYIYGAGGTLTAGTVGSHDFRVVTNDTLRANVNATTGKMHVLNDAEVGGNFNVKGTSPGKQRTINFVIDGGGGSVITTGPKGNVFVDFAGSIDGWTILGDTSGNVTVDISKSTYATFPTFTGSGGTSPALSNQQKNQRVGVNWTGFTSITANDILQFVVSGTPANVSQVTVAIDITSTT